MAPKKNTKQNAKKDSSDLGANAPDRKKPKHKKRGGGGGGADDSSVDSRGNLRGFIAYDDETDDEDYKFVSTSSEEEGRGSGKGGRRRPVRKAAEKARRRIRRKMRGATTSSDSATSKTEEEEKKTPKGRKSKPKAATDSEEEMPRTRGAGGGFVPRRKKRVEESEEETDKSTDETSDDEEDSSESDETSDEEEDEDSDEDMETSDEEEEGLGAGGLIISFGAADDGAERMIPKRHNMKKESAEVKKFVKLVTQPQEEGGIDDQIDEFKQLSLDKQQDVLSALERRPGSGGTGTGIGATGPAQQSMMFRILTMKLPPDVQTMLLGKYNTITNMDPSSGEYFKMRSWLEKMASLPLGTYKEIPVKLSDGSEACGAFMERARKCLADAIYGQEEAKIQILQFIASKIANPAARGFSLLLAGVPGVGKTSLIKNGIAKALDWPFQLISLGGDSDASTYVGHQLVYEGSHCGKIANSLIAAKSMSMIMLFDELDKISMTPKGEEVQNLLVHLTDPVQNSDFEDKYLAGIPIDLSKVLFTFSANNLEKVDKILMDRMVVVQLQGYSEKEKLAIAENFLLPNALREVNLDEKVAMSKEVLEYILKEYAGEEKGVREYKRCMEAVAQKVNMLRIYNSKDLPFHIPDFQLPFVVKKQHVDLFLKKRKAEMDVSVQRMYI